jgi:hypothetical protein
MKNVLRASRWLVPVSVACAIILNAAGAFAALDKCQSKIEKAAIKYESKLIKALEKCKDAVRKEQVKNATKGNGSLAKAAKQCEKQLSKIYGYTGTCDSSKMECFQNADCTGVGDTTCIPPGECYLAKTACFNDSECPSGEFCLRKKSEVGKFRKAMAKLRQSKTASPTCDDCTCSDADITTIGHLLSGAGGAAPPTTGDHARFLTDWILLAKEKLVLKQQLFLISDTLSLLNAAVTAPDDDPGDGNGTSCDITAAPGTATRRLNLCRFGLECHDHACQLDNSGASPGETFATLKSASLDNLTMNLPVSFPLVGRTALEVCKIGRTAGKCRNGVTCQSDGDCGIGQTPCNLFPGEGAGAVFGAQPDVLYLINQPAKLIQPPAIPPIVAAVCVDNVRSEGWCDCSGLGIALNTSFCQDRIVDATEQAGTDGCGSPGSAATDDTQGFEGTKVGQVKVNPSGSSTTGDCLELLTTRFKILTATADFGADSTPCTSDDFAAPGAAAALPVTTGSAIATVQDAVRNAGGCSGDAGGTACIEDINCTSGPTPPGGTCTFGPPDLETISVGGLVGAKTNCVNYEASNFSGVAFAGAFPAASGDPPIGDSVTAFRLKCQ